MCPLYDRTVQANYLRCATREIVQADKAARVWRCHGVNEPHPLPKKWPPLAQRRQRNNFCAQYAVDEVKPLHLQFIRPRWLLPSTEALSGRSSKPFPASHRFLINSDPEESMRYLDRRRKNKYFHKSNSVLYFSFLLTSSVIWGRYVAEQENRGGKTCQDVGRWIHLFKK